MPLLGCSLCLYVVFFFFLHHQSLLLPHTVCSVGRGSAPHSHSKRIQSWLIGCHLPLPELFQLRCRLSSPTLAPSHLTASVSTVHSLCCQIQDANGFESAVLFGLWIAASQWPSAQAYCSACPSHSQHSSGVIPLKFVRWLTSLLQNPALTLRIKYIFLSCFFLPGLSAPAPLASAVPPLCLSLFLPTNLLPLSS